jgi:hypothetical protein
MVKTQLSTHFSNFPFTQMCRIRNWEICIVFLAASINDIAKRWSPTHSGKVAKPDCARQVASDQSPALQIILAQWHYHRLA